MSVMMTDSRLLRKVGQPIGEYSETMTEGGCNDFKW